MCDTLRPSEIPSYVDAKELEAAHPFHHHPLNAQWCMHTSPLPEVNNQLLGFAGIEGEVVCQCSKEFNFLPILFIIVSDTADNRCVISKL